MLWEIFTVSIELSSPKNYSLKVSKEKLCSPLKLQGNFLKGDQQIYLYSILFPFCSFTLTLYDGRSFVIAVAKKAIA